MSKLRKQKKVALDLATPETALPAGPEPNVRFCGRPQLAPDTKKVLSIADPIESFSIGGKIVDLPAADFQKSARLFYHESAALIVRLFPALYKRIVRKGESKNNV